MTDDRRASVRRQAMLPLAWREVNAGASIGEICRRLEVPAALALQSRLSELDDEFRRLCAVLADARTADALRVLDGKLSVLEEALLDQAPQPAARPVTVSADGVGFEAAEALTVGAHLGVHLVLPVSQHLIGRGRVSYCEASDDGFRIGVELVGLETPAARRLTRYAIGRGSEDEGGPEKGSR